MANTKDSNPQNDSVVLLTGTHVEQLIVALRAASTVNVRLEIAIRENTQSNRELKAAHNKLIDLIRPRKPARRRDG